jgi:hypothetical protein
VKEQRSRNGSRLTPNSGTALPYLGVTRTRIALERPRTDEREITDLTLVVTPPDEEITPEMGEGGERGVGGGGEGP